MSIIDEIGKISEEENNVSITENGARGWKTSGHTLLDLNFAVSSLRDDPQKLMDLWEKSYIEDPELAMKWLFYCRDIRQGLGERFIFRTIFKDWLSKFTGYYKIDDLIRLIPEYGRWDDVLGVKPTSIKTIAIIYCIIQEQLRKDLSELELKSEKANISMLGKWLPTSNCSNKERIKQAQLLANFLKWTPRQYRQNISKLRKHLDIVERKMSENDWAGINYSSVPSLANLKYNKAFLVHDEERREEYLNRALKGEIKINSSTAFPHEIVNLITRSWDDGSINNMTAEAAWAQLPKKKIDNVLVVADGSGSMTAPISRKSQITALDVANSLAIYFAENNTGIFKDKYVTFSEHPELVDLTVPAGCTNPLGTKLRICYDHSEIASTNIEAVFNLVLKAAINGNLKQNEMPSSILVISDMEFDEGVTIKGTQKKLFKSIAQNYTDAGYKLPRLVFWNVNSRTGTIPVKENENGVALVSGFSINLVNQIMNQELDPWKALLTVLGDKRYEPIKLVQLLI